MLYLIAQKCQANGQKEEQGRERRKMDIDLKPNR